MFESFGLKIEPLRGDFGARIQGDGRDLLALDIGAVAQLFREKGAILFSGFETDLDRFRRFGDELGGNYHKHGAEHRSPAAGDPSGTIETAQEGMGAVRPHPELRWCPWTPELAWFYCEVPTEVGGETVLYDGLQIAGALRRETYDLLASRRIKFSYSAPPLFDWKSMLGVSSVEEATELLSSIDNSEYGAFHRFAFRDEVLVMHYVIPFLTRTKYIDRPAYVASILGEYGRTGTFEDLTPIPRELKAEIVDTCESVAVEVHWRAGEILMVDNTRVLHARRAFEDPRRSVLTRWGDSRA